MKFSSFFLISVSTWYFVSAIQAQSKDNALIFNRYSQQLEDLPASFSDKCTNCLVLCPASTDQHQIIVHNASITGNAIFLQESSFRNGVRVSKNECDDSTRPALVQNVKSTNLYSTGYEFFYPETEIKLKGENDYKNFIKVTDDEKNKSKSPSLNKNLVNKKEEDGFTKFEILGEPRTTLVFYWISVLSIQLFETGRQIKFTKDTINNLNQRDRTMVICKDYNLGDELEKVPSEKWERLQNKNAKQLEHNDLEEAQIMPMRYFHSFSARLATCIYLNIAYVWKGIAAGQLRKIDLFLYSLYREWPSDTTIIFGIKGVSKGVTDHSLKKINSSENKFLRKYPKPVPEIIYRIVQLKQNVVTSNAVVILHNLLDSPQIEERICPKNSELDGWDDIKPDPRIYPEYTQPSGLTYVCAVTPENMRKLEVPYDASSKMGDLTLNPQQKIKIERYVSEMRDKVEDDLDVSRVN